jgi:Transposase DDE domain
MAKMAKRTDSQNSARRKAKRKLTVNGKSLRDAVSWAVKRQIFADLKIHGNTKWQILDLIVLAIVWVWSDKAQLTAAFIEARHWSTQVLGRVAVATYQGLLKALVTWTSKLLPLIQERLHQLMQEYGGKHWQVDRWLALAVDGSRVSVPRTKDNEKALCAPNYGHGSTAKYRHRKKKKAGVRRRARKPEPVKPQIWITLLWHLGLQMPWSWMTGPSNSSERNHFQKMLAELKFPINTLFCADAGFVGYALWKAIIDLGHSFLIRVGANVKLLRKLGYVQERKGIVYFWPNHAAKSQQPPLVLRLLRLKVGKCVMHLVTNVQDDKQLTVKDAIRLYQLRWGVELQFRTMKQTFGRRKLRSKTPDRAMVELDWSLLGLWMIQLFAVKEQIEIGEVPEHCSVSLAIQVIRTTFQRLSERPEQDFWEQLRAATKDQYKRKRSKKARYRPNYKDKPKAGTPQVRLATREHKALLRRYMKNAA